MKEVTPNYYQRFRCIADRCRHSCCIGWEIEVDTETAERYQSLATPLGERIRRSIEGDPPHFILGEGERCPFLSGNGLCEIILESGEENLCEICTLHPRFRNFYESFCETGLGLCCEEAARIILTGKEPFSIPVPQEALTEEEQVFFGIRERIIEILQERTCSVWERFTHLAEGLGFSFGFSLEKLRKTYLSLERLDDNWTKALEGIKDFSFDRKIFEEEDAQIPMEQLAVYFVFRHLTDAIWKGDYRNRVRFALMSCFLIGALWEKDQVEKGYTDLDARIELVRMYSAEVEYSEENLERLLGE